MGEHDYRIAALKAAGYDDAARLLEALPPTTPTPAAAVRTDAEPAGRPLTSAEAVEARRQAQGKALLEHMDAQTSSGHSVSGGSLLGGDR